MTLRLLSVVSVLAVAASPSLSGAATPDISKVTAPPGFKVTLFSAPPETPYPTCLAAAPTGELYVGVDENGSLDAKPNRGRVVRCTDTDGDGRADKFVTFAKMDSPRGVWFENNTLYVMHPPFLTAYHDDNGDGVSDRSEQLVKGLGRDLAFRGADHTVNGMRMAIDGFLYIAVGDYGAIKAEGKDGTTVQLHGGGVMRVRPDGSGLETVSLGQRNIYDVAVSPELDLFTRDNTNDGGGWDVRLSQVFLGGNYGYPTLFKNFPDEIIKPLADYGGGSPTGALFLDEPGFPSGLGTALYTCDWGRNLVYRHPLEAAGTTFKPQQERFVEIPRPTDMDVDGSGVLYVASWFGATYTYSGPDVGYVVQITRPEARAEKFPDLKKAGEGDLLKHLGSASAVLRLYSQREILRREKTPSLVNGLVKLASDPGPLTGRIAALFTLRQLPGDNMNGLLAGLVSVSDLREFALKALGDDRKSVGSLDAARFYPLLKDASPRVRLQAITLLGRIGKPAAAEQIFPLAADADPILSHIAINALVSLRASAAAFKALDAADAPGLEGSQGSANTRSLSAAVRVLQALHEPAVVDGLISRVNAVRSAPVRFAVLRTLARLYQREADWDGTWWQTRPDTTGPYYKPAKWEASTRIADALRAALNQAEASSVGDFIIELQRNRVDLPEATALVMKLAGNDAKFRTVAIDLFAGRPVLPDQAIGLFAGVASSSTESPALRAKAVRALQKSSAKDEALEAAITALTREDKLPGELDAVWQEFTRETRFGQRLNRFAELAQKGSPAERRLGYGVLANLATARLGRSQSKAPAFKFIDDAWENPESAVPLLQVLAVLKIDAFNTKVRALTGDARSEVAAAARLAAQALGLSSITPAETAAQKIEAMKYEEVLAVALREKGDAAEGAKVFVQAGCAACHTVTATEVPKGPYLGGIATRYSRTELCESILQPHAKIAQGFETQWFEVKGGDELEGFVSRDAGDELDVRNIAGVTTTIAKKDIVKRGKRDQSIMPAGLMDKMTPRDLASLLAYLESTKGN